MTHYLGARIVAASGVRPDLGMQKVRDYMAGWWCATLRSFHPIARHQANAVYDDGDSDPVQPCLPQRREVSPGRQMLALSRFHVPVIDAVVGSAEPELPNGILGPVADVLRRGLDAPEPMG